MIGTMVEFKMYQAEYKKIRQIVQKFQDSVPKKWPQQLPNLSSHNGKPFLQIRDPADYMEILSSYWVYIRKMEATRNDWTVLLRTLHPAVLLNPSKLNINIV